MALLCHNRASAGSFTPRPAPPPVVSTSRQSTAHKHFMMDNSLSNLHQGICSFASRAIDRECSRGDGSDGGDMWCCWFSITAASGSLDGKFHRSAGCRCVCSIYGIASRAIAVEAFWGAGSKILGDGGEEQHFVCATWSLCGYVRFKFEGVGMGVWNLL